MNFGEDLENITNQVAANYDGGEFDNYDGEGYDTPVGMVAAPKKKRPLGNTPSNITITIINSTTTDLGVELFGPLNSMFLAQRTDLAKGAFSYLPYPRLDMFNTNGNSKAGSVGFDQYGNGLILGAAINNPANGAPAYENVKIICRERPYVQVLEHLAAKRFQIAKVKLTLTTAYLQQQQQQAIVWERKTWLGRKESDDLNPSTFQSNSQYLPNILEVPSHLKMAPDCNLLYTMSAATGADAPNSAILQFIIYPM